jgi:hypothetical protein
VSNLILGGVGFSKLTRNEANSFLGIASEQGISSIDTAPTYGDSEAVIGSSKRVKDWQVSTKVGYPNGPRLNRQEIIKSIDGSLKRLKIERIHTCFIHSMQYSNVDEELIESLRHLQFLGKIEHVGYSGDGLDLNLVLSNRSVDKVMATLNILDLSNLQTIREFGSGNVFLKRILCNSVFRIKPRLELIDYIHRLKNIPALDSASYSFRFHQIFGKRNIFKNYPDQFFSFVLSLGLQSKYLIGTTNPHHLKQIAGLEKRTDFWSIVELDDYIANWEQLALKYQWFPLV